MTVSDLISGMLREDGGFQKAFRSILDDELGMSLNEFCQLSGISQSTMYKILEDKREPNLRTVRQVIKALKILMEADDSHFIAVIASTTVVENLPRTIEMEGGVVINVREYPVSTVEDAIIAAVRAERDGALGVVCAPIVAPTIEKILAIPVSRVIPTSSVMLAIDRLRDFI
ncbi:MAG: helix-turn-helix domain-containing protein [Candidatus Methanomethylophilaceae archaeon]|nr:helix-turn-helix domain-containing protein [Candidatus Methanomethylophilaceae archaeon]